MLGTKATPNMVPGFFGRTKGSRPEAVSQIFTTPRAPPDGEARAIEVKCQGVGSGAGPPKIEEPLACGHVPEADHPVLTAQGDPTAVRMIRQGPERPDIRPEGPDLAAGARVPEANPPGRVGRDHPLAVRAERQAHHQVGVALEHEQLPPGRRVPDLDVTRPIRAPIQIGGRQSPPVRAEGQRDPEPSCTPDALMRAVHISRPDVVSQTLTSPLSPSLPRSRLIEASRSPPGL